MNVYIKRQIYLLFFNFLYNYHQDHRVCGFLTTTSTTTDAAAAAATTSPVYYFIIIFLILIIKMQIQQK